MSSILILGLAHGISQVRGLKTAKSGRWFLLFIKAKESKATVRNELLQLKRGLGRGTTTTDSVMPNMQKDQYK